MRQRKIYQISQGLLVALTIMLIVISVIQGIQLKVWSYLGDYYLGTYSLKAKPFAGWLFDESGGRVLDSLVEFINQNVPQDDSLLVISNNTVLYGLTGRESYRGMPIMSFQNNITPVPGRQLERVRTRILEDPPNWIVTDLNTYLVIFSYLNIQQEFLKHYLQVQSWGMHAIFRRVN